MAGPRQGAATAGRWRSTSVRGGSSRALPLCARADADRLMTAGDAAERRWTRGPWRGGWFGGAGYTAAGTTRPARTPGLIVVVVVVLVLVRILRDDGWPLAARCGRRVIHEF